MSRLCAAAILCGLAAAYPQGASPEEENRREKEQLAAVFFDPFFALTVDNLRRALSRHQGDADAPALPAAIAPAALLDKESLRGRALRAVTEAFTAAELRVLHGFYNTRLGVAIIAATRKTKNDIAASYHTALAELTRDFGAAEEREVAPFLADFKALKPRADRIGGIILRVAKAHAAERLAGYYRERRFTRRDSSLCSFFHKKTFAFYALPVCDAGLAAGDYESALLVAEQHRRGRLDGRPRDVERAKAILRELLGRDREGKAHFRLGLLTKNAPDEGDAQARSVCLLRTAANLGYKPAREALKGFAPAELRASCVNP